MKNNVEMQIILAVVSYILTLIIHIPVCVTASKNSARTILSVSFSPRKYEKSFRTQKYLWASEEIKQINYTIQYNVTIDSRNLQIFLSSIFPNIVRIFHLSPAPFTELSKRYSTILQFREFSWKGRFYSHVNGEYRSSSEATSGHS